MLFNTNILLILAIWFVRNSHLKFCADKRSNVLLTHPSSIIHSKHIRYFSDTLRWFTKIKNFFLWCDDIRLIVYLVMTWGEIIITWGVTWGGWIFRLGCRCGYTTSQCLLEPYCKINEWRDNFYFSSKKSFLSATWLYHIECASCSTFDYTTSEEVAFYLAKLWLFLIFPSHGVTCLMDFVWPPSRFICHCFFNTSRYGCV